MFVPLVPFVPFVTPCMPFMLPFVVFKPSMFIMQLDDDSMACILTPLAVLLP